MIRSLLLAVVVLLLITTNSVEATDESSSMVGIWYRYAIEGDLIYTELIILNNQFGADSFFTRQSANVKTGIVLAYQSDRFYWDVFEGYFVYYLGEDAAYGKDAMYQIRGDKLYFDTKSDDEDDQIDFAQSPSFYTKDSQDGEPQIATGMSESVGSPDNNTTFDYLLPQRAIFPMAIMRITQGINSNPSHKNDNYYAIDLGGKDTKIDNVVAPFDAVIVRIDPKPNDTITNTVFIQSQKKVLFADGTLDYMVIRFAHDNDIAELVELAKQIPAQTIPQGTVIYQEGTAGTSANHVHMVISRGKIGNSNRYHGLEFVHPADALVIDPRFTTEILDDEGYDWVYCPTP